MNTPVNPSKDPHQGQPTLAAGEQLEHAKAAVVLLHGRGASALDILSLAPKLIPDGSDQPGLAFLAPQAAGGTWYPNRFLDPTNSNEPWLSSALARVDQTLSQIVQAGIPYEHILLLGFSQGGCLALEYAARNGRRYGGLAGLSAGLIGADGEPRLDSGSLDGTRVFLGSSDLDFHIPKARLEQSALILRQLGGDVTLSLYPNMGHTINQDELEFVRGMVADLIPFKRNPVSGAG